MTDLDSRRFGGTGVVAGSLAILIAIGCRSPSQARPETEVLDPDQRGGPAAIVLRFRSPEGVACPEIDPSMVAIRRINEGQRVEAEAEAEAAWRIGESRWIFWLSKPGRYRFAFRLLEGYDAPPPLTVVFEGGDSPTEDVWYDIDPVTKNLRALGYSGTGQDLMRRHGMIPDREAR